MMEELRFSETSVLIKASQRNIPNDNIIHSHFRENLRFYKLRTKVRKPTIQTEKLLLTGEVNVNFCWQRGVAWSAQRVSTVVDFNF
jgi:hypothetical protein